VEACTRQPQRVRLRFGNHYLTLVDLPGVGESVTRDGNTVSCIGPYATARYGAVGAQGR
jgi:predicted GTPase